MSPEAVAFRDLTYDRVAAFGLFKTVKNGVMTAIEPADELPAATVFLRRDRLSPDGDDNAGVPSFVQEVTLGLLVTIDAGSQQELEPALHLLTQKLVGCLMSDPAFIAEVEAVTGIDETQNFPKDGETYYAEARIEMTVKWRVDFEPCLPDDYRGASMTTRPYGKGEATPPIRSKLTNA